MGTPARKHFDFLSKRRNFGLVSALLVIGSLALTAAPGPNYRIDFRGGTNIIAKFNAEVGDEAVRSALSTAGIDDAAVQSFGAAGDFEYLIQTQAVTSMNEERRAALSAALDTGFGEGTAVEFDETQGDRVYVQVPESAYGSAEGLDEIEAIQRFSAGAADVETRIIEALSAAEFENITASAYGNPGDRRFQIGVATIQAVVADGFRSELGDDFASIERVETVGPRVGEQLRGDAVKAILLALVCILLYIALRFDMRYAPGAIVALFHDVLITLGIFIILREEISLPILAAALTIVGYSLNDTIVNFDRIRENLQVAERKTDIVALVNRSLNECLSRTLLTSVTTLVAVVTIYILGGGLIRSFALAMIIGVIIGTYSSIFVASPIFLVMNDYFEARDRAKAAERAAAATAAG